MPEYQVTSESNNFFPFWSAILDRHFKFPNSKFWNFEFRFVISDPLNPRVSSSIIIYQILDSHFEFSIFECRFVISDPKNPLVPSFIRNYQFFEFGPPYWTDISNFRIMTLRILTVLILSSNS